MEVDYGGNSTVPESEGGEGEGSRHRRTPKSYNDTHFRLLFPQESVGRVIGKNGENLKKCRQSLSSGAFVRVPECPSSSTCQDRVLMVSSLLTDVPTVIRQVAPYIFSGIERPEKELLLLVPTDQAGSLIGSGGSTIDLIRKASNCQVKMYKDRLPYSDERVFFIPGSIEQLENMILAVMEVLNHLKKQPLSHEIIHYNPVIACDEDFVSKDCGGYTKARIDRSGKFRTEPESTYNRDSNYNYSASQGQQPVHQQEQQWNSFISSMQHMTGISVNKGYPDTYSAADYHATANPMSQIDTAAYPTAGYQNAGSYSTGYQSAAAPVNYTAAAYSEPNYIDQALPRSGGDVYNMYSSTPKSADTSRDTTDRHHTDRHRTYDDRDRRDRDDYRDRRHSRDHRDAPDSRRTRHRTRSRSPPRRHHESYRMEDEFMNEDITKEIKIDDGLTSYIIGPKGSRIKSVRDQTSAFIKIDDDEKVTEGKRGITIKGRVKEVMWAFQRIKQLIQDAMSQNSAPDQGREGAAPRREAIDSELFRIAQQQIPYTPSDNRSTDTETTNLSVNNKNTGAIIGMKANVIMEIRRISNCKIVIAKDTEVQNDLRPIEITGVPRDIHLAEYLIEAVQQLPKDISLSRRNFGGR